MSSYQEPQPKPPGWMTEDSALGQAITEHVAMVYSTARRVLGNEAQAADVVQETFFHFARNAHRIQGAVSGWLHRVATRRSYDLIRQETSRRQREQEYSLCHQEPDTTWNELEPVLDAALDELPEPSRELLVRHFLEGRTTIQIAADNGWSQPTASRRIAQALDELRTHLRKRGVAVSLAMLVPLLTQSTQAAPVSVIASLGKVALAHSATSLSMLPPTAAATATLATSSHPLPTSAIAASLCVLLGVGGYLNHSLNTRDTTPLLPTKPILVTPRTSITLRTTTTPTQPEEPTIPPSQPNLSAAPQSPTPLSPVASVAPVSNPPFPIASPGSVPPQTQALITTRWRPVGRSMMFQASGWGRSDPSVSHPNASNTTDTIRFSVQATSTFGPRPTAQTRVIIGPPSSAPPPHSGSVGP